MTARKGFRRGQLRAAAIEARLAELGRTRVWLAAELGVAESTLFRWTRGSVRIEGDSAVRLARALSVGVGEVATIPGLSLLHDALAARALGVLPPEDTHLALGAALQGHRAAVRAWPWAGYVAEVTLPSDRAVAVRILLPSDLAGIIVVSTMDGLFSAEAGPRVEHVEVAVAPGCVSVRRFGPAPLLTQFPIEEGALSFDVPASHHARTLLVTSCQFPVQVEARQRHDCDQFHFTLTPYRRGTHAP